MLVSVFVLITVSPQTQAQQGKSTHPGSEALDDLPVDDAANLSVLGPHEDAAKKIRENIFVVARCDRVSCFTGQQVLLTCKLYTALQSNSIVSGKPSLDGFSSSELQADATVSGTETRGRKHYRVFTIWRVILTPLQAGSFTLDPLTVNNEVTYTAADGSPGHYSGLVSSNKLVISVLPLPVVGRPAAFAGAVGRWSISGRLASDKMDTEDVDTFFISIEGQGNFAGLPAPEVHWPVGFRVFQPTERRDLKPNTFPQSGKKVIAMPFTAAAPGKFILPPVTVGFFDPLTGGYRAAQSEDLELEVRTAPVAAAIPSPKDGGANPRRPLWYGLALAGAAAVFVVLMLWRRKRPVVAVPEVIPEEGSDLAAGLAKVEEITDEEDYLAGVKQLLVSWLQARLHSDSPAEEHLLRLLRASDSQLADEMQQLLERCNGLLYSPGRRGTEMRSDLRERVMKVLQTGG
jgi:hypothetical protein